jgi:hypothetical protein
MTIHLPRFRPALRAAVALLACLLLPTTPARAGQVVQVRVGNHPEFTRVVFELDAPARYRVERRDGTDPELIVTIDAASRPRRIRSKSLGIEAVEVTSQGQTSVARVALRKPGLRLKEMILANPSRIVLDLVHDAPAPKPVAKAPAPKPAAPPAPKPEPVAKQPEPSPEPAPVAKAPLTPPAPKPEVAPSPAPEVVAQAPSPEPAPAVEPELPAQPEAPVAPAPPKPAAPVAKPVTPKPAPIAKPTPPAPPRAEQAQASDGPPLEILAGAAVGVLLCVVGLVVLLRRRRPRSDERDELGDEASDGDAEQRSFTEMVFSETDAQAPGASAETGGASDLDSFFDEERAADATSESRGDDVMSEGFTDLPTDRGGAALPPAGPVVASGSGPDPDVLRVVHELERRMGQLEGKLNDSNEARERLERQVAAQSEELRVQRAAIARTQRALRSLSRGEEEKATEPALREEDTQAKTRINV